jgi:hypothetical protein
MFFSVLSFQDVVMRGIVASAPVTVERVAVVQCEVKDTVGGMRGRMEVMLQVTISLHTLDY